jgi:hypothetical protein
MKALRFYGEVSMTGTKEGCRCLMYGPGFVFAENDKLSNTRPILNGRDIPEMAISRFIPPRTLCCIPGRWVFRFVV